MHISSDAESDGWKRGLHASFAIFALSFVYTFVRYHVIRDVPLSDLPLYTMNKAVALASVIIIGMSFLLGPLCRFLPSVFSRHLDLRKSLGLLGFGAAALHAFLSLILLSPEYYAKFFAESGRLNLIGESSLLFGVLGLLVFTAVAISSLPEVSARLSPGRWKTIQRLGYLAYVFVLFHVAIMGWRGWMNLEAYQYGFVSISLVAALFIVFVLVVRAMVSLFPHKKSSV